MNTREALRLYIAAAKSDGKNPDILWRISKMHTDLAIASKSENAALKHADRAIDFARRGVASAPRHAMAHAVLAVAYGQKAVFVPNTEKMDLSKLLYSHAGTALEIDASNTVAMLVLGIWHREVASLNWVVRLLLKAAYGDVPEASLEESQRLLAQAPSQLRAASDHAACRTGQNPDRTRPREHPPSTASAHRRVHCPSPTSTIHVA
jgi:hypothetical protein